MDVCVCNGPRIKKAFLVTKVLMLGANLRQETTRIIPCINMLDSVVVNISMYTATSRMSAVPPQLYSSTK